MKKNNKIIDNTYSRNKAQDSIDKQVKDFLEKGGNIEVLSSPFDSCSDPKCRLGENMGFFN